MHRWNVKTPTLFPEPSGMIVYGDPSVQESLRPLVERLEESLSLARPDSLDDVRRLLIAAGMLEQAALDAGLPEGEAFGRPVKRLAEAFVALWSGSAPDAWPEDVASLLLRLPRGAATLNVKMPEGFAFYGLYPEAYIEAARAWMANCPGWEKVAVVGVRSIGTTLSAVVAATLRAASRDVVRLTVRPSGHPFAREASIPPDDLRGASWALVVDEGPGLSGSSMASVAEALVRAGIERTRIAFLPGHGGEPDGMASEETRAWWREASRFAVGAESLRWDGRTLEETLAERTGNARSVEELTGGRWRALAYDDPAEWPAVAMPFERRKILVRRKDGSAVLWKFVGLTVPQTVLGFYSEPWIEGVPLRAEDADAELMAWIGRHIASVARPAFSAEEVRASEARLAEMLRVNAEEAFGSDSPLPMPAGEESVEAGDYRLAPCEWRHLDDGRIVKAGRIAPTLDHTIVGRQPVAWDVAGTIVEWNLDAERAKPLLSSAPSVSTADLRFYTAAYAAFRMGQCRFCAEQAGPEERARLERESARYKTQLQNVLQE